MKRYLKYLLSLFALILMISGVPMISLQAAEGNGTSGSEDINIPPATDLKSGSISKNKTGWL